MASARTFALAAALAAIALVAPVSAADQPAYTQAGSIAGPDGFWDYANWDAADGLVLVGHGNNVLLADPASGTARSVGDIVRGHIALAIPRSGNMLVTSGGDNSVRIIDRLSGDEQARIAVGAGPDAAVLSPDGAHGYVMNAQDGTLSVLDLKTDRETARIKLKEGLEAGGLIGAGELAVNNEDRSEVELVNVASGKADGTIALPGCTGPTGFAYAPERHLSVSTCGNGKAALVDTKARKLVRLLDIGAGPDTALWDGRRQRFIIPCGRSGTLSVISFGKADTAPTVSQSPSEMSARTAAIDPVTGRIFLPAARFGQGEPGKRPPLVPGSFHVLVMTPVS